MQLSQRVLGGLHVGLHSFEVVKYLLLQALSILEVSFQGVILVFQLEVLGLNLVLLLSEHEAKLVELLL